MSRLTPEWLDTLMEHVSTEAFARRQALKVAFWNVRRDVWNEREMRLVAKWESYG